MYICTYRRKHATPLSVFREHSPAGYVGHATGTEKTLYVRGWQGWNIGEILKEKQEEYQDCHATGCCCYVQAKNVAQVGFGWGLFKQDIGTGSQMLDATLKTATTPLSLFIF